MRYKELAHYVAEDPGMDLTAEQKLAVACLTRAIRDYVGDILPYKRGRGSEEDNERIKRSARCWVASESEDTYSFLWICEALDIDSEALRSVIRSLSKDPAAAKALSGRLAGIRRSAVGAESNRMCLRPTTKHRIHYILRMRKLRAG